MKNQIIYGIQTISEVLKNTPWQIVEVFLPKYKALNPAQKNILNIANENNIPINFAKKNFFDKYFEMGWNHQGAIAKISCSNTNINEKDIDEYLSNKCKESKDCIVLVLDGVTDAHNLGACLRVADGFGVSLVILPERNSAKVDAVVSKIACGAAQWVTICRVVNIARTLVKLKDLGFTVIGTTGEKEDSCQYLQNAILKCPIAMVMGSEFKGIRKNVKDNCDFLVRIPMFGNVSSFNVSVSTGICLYTIRGQTG